MSLKRSRAIAARNKSRGMTLIEILVTVLLVSVGLLGVAALQLTTLRGNQEAYVRSQASELANNILDRMRANQAASGQYAVDFNGTGAAGTPAGNDLDTWQREINRVLPGGDANAAGRIQVAGPSNNVVTITIQWSEREDRVLNEAEGLRTFQTRSEI